MKTLRKIGCIMGSVVWFISSYRRNIAIKNAEIIGVDNPVLCAKKSFQHTFMSYMESFYIHNVTSDFMNKYIKIECNEQAPERLTGEIVISAHFGCWELAAPCLAVLSPLKIGLLARKIKNPKIDKFVMEQRGFSDNMIYLHHRDSAAQINKLLDSNAHIAALLDHASTMKDSIFVPFFGLNTTFNKGLAVIAVRKNISIRPAFLIRTEDGGTFYFSKSIHPDSSLKPKERVREIALRINKEFEKIISKYPEQWYLLHKRFKLVEDKDGKISSSIY